MLRRGNLFAILVAVLAAGPFAAGNPPTAAVTDFAARGLSADEAQALSDRFQAELAHCGGYRLLERSRIGDVLREQGFQQAGCTSTECAVQTGRLLGVERMMTGTVSQVGRTWTVQAREVDVQSGEILRAATVDRTGPVDELLTQGMSELCRKLVPSCPGPSPAAPEEAPAAPVAQVSGPGVAVFDSMSLFPSRDDGARAGSTPFQIAFFGTVAIPSSRHVHGLAVDVFLGRISGLAGVQAGLVNVVDSVSVGVQAGLCQMAGENRGVQAGFAERARLNKGIQAGVLNSSVRSVGLQAGLLNVSDSVQGMQVGVFNSTQACTGIQFGLLNFWKTSGGSGRLLPFVGCL